jgi:putative ABC transport system permease protein
MGILGHLLLRNLLRNRLRSVLTGLGIMVAVIAFGLLRSLVDAFHAGADSASATRLITRNAVSLAIGLPLTYRDRIRQLPGVTRVSMARWFGGVYGDGRRFFPQFAVDPVNYLALYPEYLLPAAERAVFERDRNCAIVGRQLAQRFGWRLGDTIPLAGTFYPGEWRFRLCGIYRGATPVAEEGQMFLHYALLNERLRQENHPRRDQVGVWVVGIDDASRAAAIAMLIDSQFRNSRAETLTETERAFQLSFVAMASAIMLVIEGVSWLVLLVVLVVMANTLAMAVRERRAEYATLKALGFGPRHLIGLIAGESLLLATLAGLLGCVLLLPLADAIGLAIRDFIPVLDVHPLTLLEAMAAALAVGCIAAAWPVWYVLRVPVTVALRSHD